MEKYLKKFENHTDYETYINGQDVILPNVSLCKQENEVHYNPVPHNYSKDYFTIEALENDIDIIYTSGYASYYVLMSTDEGETWSPQVLSETITLNAGEKVLIKGNNSVYYDGEYDYMYGIHSTGLHIVYGNILSLVYGDNFMNYTELPESSNYNFFRFFKNDMGLVSAENLILPNNTVPYCYANMFYNCSNLTKGPKLPATTLSNGCYGSMFYQTALTESPKLPATTLQYQCYQYMFYGCTRLITAPVLPATTLVESCYYKMFYNCSNLNYIKAMFTTEPGNYTDDWVNGVAEEGTFVKNSAAQWDVSGVSGIPSGWTVETASE